MTLKERSPSGSFSGSQSDLETVFSLFPVIQVGSNQHNYYYYYIIIAVLITIFAATRKRIPFWWNLMLASNICRPEHGFIWRKVCPASPANAACLRHLSFLSPSLTPDLLLKQTFPSLCTVDAIVIIQRCNHGMF